MTNAFPTTDIATLWSLLYTQGVAGPWFDFIRMVYAGMSYVVRSEGAYSAAFRCLIGLLTGDTASPGFWNVYFADFRLPHHDADVRLNGRSSKYMIFGPLPPVLPVFRVGDDVVELVPEFKYVGMWFTSTHPNIFAAHYADKASKARRTANVTLASVKTHLGSLPVKEGLRLLLEEHIEVQHTFLRGLLGLNSSSMLAILYTETGQTPIKIRRLPRALSRLRYLLNLPADEDRIVRDAFLDSCGLFRERKPGWHGDIALVLRRLPTPILVPEQDLLDDDRVQGIMEEVERILDADLQRDINELTKTHLLRDRVERIDDGEGASHRGLVTRRRRHYLDVLIRHYLDVLIPSHRKALTRLLLSDHNLSVERLRVPRAIQGSCAEGNALVSLLSHSGGGRGPCVAYFLRYIAADVGGFEDKWSPDGAYEFLKWLLSERKVVTRLAKFVADVMAVFAKMRTHAT
ncbi:hypothetical protein C8R43DRAFT_951577 [Mycena crocata]|nr:hypothetical protein C8R43DRAFT_951577 [Mycena crocata]